MTRTHQLQHEVLIKDTAAVIKIIKFFMRFPTSYIQEEHNLAIYTSLLICGTIYCMCYTFYHQHLYYVIAPEDVRHSTACPCWFGFYRVPQFYVFKLGLVGPQGVLDGTSWVEGQEWSVLGRCLSDITISKGQCVSPVKTGTKRGSSQPAFH